MLSDLKSPLLFAIFDLPRGFLDCFQFKHMDILRSHYVIESRRDKMFTIF